jgi:transposase-like protein
MNNKGYENIRERLPELAGMLTSGSSIAEATRFLGVSPSTLRRYRKQHPELDELFKRRNSICDDMVEAALLKRATGYEDSNGKEIAPDVRAALFWLQNRRPKRWKKASNTKAKNSKPAFSIQLSPVEAEL